MIKLWYMVQSSQHSTETTPHKTITVSRPLRLDTALTDALNASIQYGNAAIFEMPAGHIIAEYENGKVTYAAPVG